MNTSPAVIAAHADIPATADSGSTFTATVSLTSSTQTSGSLSVQVVDVGTVTPQIECGQPQQVTVGGAAVDFSCRAPQANLGSSNTHELQVDVKSKPNLASPVAIDVLNGGLVSDKLTNVSGSAITVAAPGQTVNVAFTTTSTPPGVGQYTVSAPSGWQMTNGGVCPVQGVDCTVTATVPASAPNGLVAIQVASEEGSSRLESDRLSFSIQSQPPTEDMTFQYAQNVSDTLYANLPSQSVTFTYKPEFVFKNTSQRTLDITAAPILGLSSLTYTCNTAAPSASPACSLPAGKTYIVDGELANTFNSLPTNPTSISISLKGSTATYVQHDMTVTFVKYVAGHVAVRVVNSNGDKVHVAAAYHPTGGLTMVDFAATSGVGTLASSPGASFQSDQLELDKDGGVIYMPYGASGNVYFTRGGNGFNSEDVPSPTASPLPPAFVALEMTYTKLFGQSSSSASCPTSATICESLTADQTYVNFISMLATINAMGNAAPLSLDTQDASFGVISNKSQATIFSEVETNFDSQGAPWKYDATNGMKNFIQKDAGDNITEILAPITADGVAAFDPIPSGYYDTYVNALWTYLGTTPIYVDASGVSNSPGCVLQGQVVPSSSTSPNAGKLVFSQSSGTCAPEADSVLGTMKGNECGYKPDGSGGYEHDTLLCADTPNLVFDTFNDCDFFQAAGSLDCHPLPDPTSSDPTTPVAIDRATFFENEGLWGPNGTYRAVVGRAIASYQAIGLLPQCANPTRVMTSANAAADVVNGLGFTNPSCLSGVSTPTYNVYAGALLPYVNVYTYSYGDFLGRDGTVTYTYSAFPVSLANDIPRAQPVTVTLH
ncbi:MAG: beta-1,3-glucanase family protein [Gammaproteobacteria bacterium]